MKVEYSYLVTLTRNEVAKLLESAGDIVPEGLEIKPSSITAHCSGYGYNSSLSGWQLDFEVQKKGTEAAKKKKTTTKKK